MRRLPIRDEGGSLPLVMIASIILAGVIVALFTVVRGGVDFAQQDRDWHAAIQVADAGVQEGLSLIRNGDFATECPGGNCTIEGEVGDRGSYTAEYTQSGCGFEVTSTGVYAARQRVAVGEICRNDLVGEAGVVGRTEVRIAGAFQAAEGTVLGTEGRWNFSGAAPCDNLGGLEEYNEGVEDSGCGIDVERRSQEFPNIARFAFFEDEAVDTEGNSVIDGFTGGFSPVGVCSPEARAERGDPLYDEYPADVIAAGKQPFDRGTIYCVKKVVFNNDATLTGPSGDTDYVRVFVSPGGDGATFTTTSVTVDQKANTSVNFSGGVAGDAAQLQLFVANGRVEIGAGNPEFAGIIYGPESYCQLKGTPEYNGIIVCDTADMRGNFTRPSDLGDVLQFGRVDIQSWKEPIG